MNAIRLDLSSVPPDLHKLAFSYKAAGDLLGLLRLQPSGARLAFVCDNMRPLKDRGIYEVALLEAYTAPRIGHFGWALGTIEWLFMFADRDKLRAAGDPLPPTEPGDRFTLYRGVAGKGRYRHVTGMSWTPSVEVARWFAVRGAGYGADPAVYQTTIAAADVLVCTNGRQEQDFIFRAKRVKRLDITVGAVEPFPRRR